MTLSKSDIASDLLPQHKRTLFQTTMKRLSEIGGWEYLFRSLIIAFILWGLYNFKILYEIHTDVKYKDFQLNSIYDFKVSFLWALIFWGYRSLMDKIVFNWSRSLLDPEKFSSEEERDERAKKYCKWVGSVVYYTLSTVIAFILFRDQFFFPVILGGDAQCSDIFFSYPNVPHIPYAKLYYMAQFGNHLHTLLEHIIVKFREPKFYEMFLHHGMSVFLIFYSYLTNTVPIGILVLVTHDPSDVLLDLSRAYNDYKDHKKQFVAAIYASFVLSWLYFRLFAFPGCIVSAAWEFYIALDYSQPTLIILRGLLAYQAMMLTALVGLHLYWFIFIVKIALNVCGKKKDVNIYDTKKIG